MKKFLLMVAVAATALLADSQFASARRGGRGGCGGGGGGCGGCGGGYMGGGGMGYGGCGMGGCGNMMGGYGGGMMMGGCSSCGGCGMVMGGGATMGGCVNGVCPINSGTAVAQTTGTEATLVVNLPADATLTIDDEPTVSTSANRVFVTPALEEGKEYEYTLKAKVLRDGQVQVTTAKVTVRPGKTSEVELTVPAAGVAAQ
jgi:uncharacterized protein (TIGR03000 family)